MNGNAFDLTQVGGKKLFLGTEEVWYFGWMPPQDRPAEVQTANDNALETMPAFSLQGLSRDSDKVFLWECWKHPLVVSANGGKIFPGFHQLSGSCVGAGGGNVVYSTAAIEVVRNSDPEQALVPFWPLPYGRSRYHAGMRGRGEGSLGSTFARAMRDDGIIPANMPGLPKIARDDDGIAYEREVEFEWSDGGRVSESWLEQGRRHLIKTTAPIRNADQLRDAIQNYYACTFAGDWGGMMECRIAGTPPVLLNERRGVWNHQQSIQGWMNHPELGEIFYVLNQWGTRVHGICPTGAPPGGYWIRAKDADYQCRNGEVFAFSQFAGFPSATFSWDV